MTTEVKEGFAEWAILEVMGHRRLAGFVREVELFGGKMCRIDVPGEEGTVATQFYGEKSIYCLTVTTEAEARAAARRSRPEPVTRWEQLPAPPSAEEVRQAWQYDDEAGGDRDEDDCPY